MTPDMTPILNPWTLAALYAASTGFFAPGALAAVRMRAETAPKPTPNTP